MSQPTNPKPPVLGVNQNTGRESSPVGGPNPLLGQEGAARPLGGSRTVPVPAAQPDKTLLEPPDNRHTAPLPLNASAPAVFAEPGRPDPSPPATPDSIQFVQPGHTNARSAVISLAEFQSGLKDWIAALEKELPAPTQQSTLAYLESNFDRLSMDLYARVRGRDAR